MNIFPFFPAQTAQSTKQKFSQDSFFGDDFNDDFAKLDKQDEIYDRFDQGFENWEQRCLKVAGKDALDAWLKEQEKLVLCFMDNFKVTNIQSELEVSKSKGELDLFFKKYCE